MGTRPEVYTCRKWTALRLRFLERVELGTTYPDVVERVVQVTRSRDLLGRCHLVVDGTGVGRPVVDLLRRGEAGMPDNAGGDYVGTTGRRGSTVTTGFRKRDLMVQGFTGAVAAGRVTDSGRIEVWRGPGGGDGGDGSEGDIGGAGSSSAHGGKGRMTT